MPKVEETFEQMRKRLIADKSSRPKQKEIIPERRYFLIVTEGFRTEPIYFDYLRKLLPIRLAEMVEIKPAITNTIRVVKEAIRLRERRLKTKTLPLYDEVWTVFDKDDFPARHFNQAVLLASKNGIEHGASNQSFELWYLLHFEYLENAVTREQYVSKLSKLLGFPYEKNDSKVVERLFKEDKYKTAIKNARRLEVLHQGKTPAQSNPSTRVYVLVERLTKYLTIY